MRCFAGRLVGNGGFFRMGFRFVGGGAAGDGDAGGGEVGGEGFHGVDLLQAEGVFDQHILARAELEGETDVATAVAGPVRLLASGSWEAGASSVSEAVESLPARGRSPLCAPIRT